VSKLSPAKKRNDQRNFAVFGIWSGLAQRLLGGRCRHQWGTLQGSNIEAARAALRSLLGDIPVFQIGRHLAARVTINQGALMRNPGAVLLVGSGGRIPSLLSVIPRLQARRYPRAAAQSAQQP
jgi:hypothetical protein